MNASCKNWAGTRNRFGYGVRYFQGKMINAHRAAWIEAYGPIVNGLEVHHICRNRSCVNLSHLSLMTHRENTLEGNTVSGINSRKTECVNGHPLSGSNLYQKKSGKRECRICRRAARLKFNRKGGI